MNGVKICPVCSKEFPRELGKCPDDGVLLVSLDTGAGFSPEELIGQVVDGRFRIEAIIGKGGMGTVYSCKHVVVGKRQAIKVLRPGAERSEDVLQRFIREAQAANAVRTRHIVEMTDFGQLPNGSFYMVMELLEGQNFSKLMRANTLSQRQLLHIFIQVSEALHQAHSVGVIHRDLKPDNVFLTEENGDPLFVKLLDFGIAKFLHQQASQLTETGVILGTPYYMSPEQARAEAVDHRTDIYALGVMMYRAFTGRLPFLADSAMGVLTAHLTEAPELPSRICNLDVPTERAILRCLEKKPADRFQSMEDVALALRAIIAPEAHQTFQDPSSGMYPMIVPPVVANEMRYGGAVGPGASPMSHSGPQPAMGASGMVPAVSGAYPGSIPGPPPSAPNSVVPAGTPMAGVPMVDVGPRGIPVMKNPAETGTGAALVTSHTGRMPRVEGSGSGAKVAIGAAAMLVAGAAAAFILFGPTRAGSDDPDHASGRSGDGSAVVEGSAGVEESDGDDVDTADEASKHDKRHKKQSRRDDDPGDDDPGDDEDGDDAEGDDAEGDDGARVNDAAASAESSPTDPPKAGGPVGGTTRPGVGRPGAGTPGAGTRPTGASGAGASGSGVNGSSTKPAATEPKEPKEDPPPPPKPAPTSGDVRSPFAND